MNKDTLHVIMSDMHTGSVNALMVDGTWRGQETNDITPSLGQKKIRAQFEQLAEEVKAARKGCRVKLLLNGDLIEGVHHGGGQIFTTDELEMAKMSADLINEFKKRIDWSRGDEVYITRGTTVHVKTLENFIGEKVNAVMDGGFYVHSKLVLETNGVVSVMAHTGPRVGDGQNEGNSLRNFMKSKYVTNLKDGERSPDIYIFSHVHQPYYAVVEAREKMKFRLIHGIITPSLQMKTVYALDKMPHAKNRVGGVYQLITADGLIGTPCFSVMET